MEDYQTRVIEEHADLKIKVEKLYAFIADDTPYADLDKEDQILISDQYQAMVKYKVALEKRIERF